MDNELYKLMIYNAKAKLAKQNPAMPVSGDMTVFEVAEFMSMLIGRDSGKILMDLIK